MGKRIPSLDGLRAISILFVLLSHGARTPGSGWINALERPFGGELGTLGVRIFFVISGFLITSLLVAEHETRGRISLKDFYMRRALRILPALYVFLLATWLATRAGWVQAPTRDFVHALTWSTNYFPERAWLTGHTWSLAVEEQFYVLWPATLVLVGLAGGVHASVAFLLLAPVARVVLFRAVPSYRPYIEESFETVGDAMAAGCILAISRAWLYAQPLYRRLLESPLVWLVPVAIFGAHRLHHHPSFHFTVGILTMNIGIAVMIDRVTRHPPAVLEHPILRFIGKRSYSLYLWQQPFMDDNGSVFTRVPLNFACAFVLAMVSYEFVEQPILRLRARFQAR